ncbi:glycosyltransferase [Nonlabens ponticola]|uniref:Glycosyltransferase n=1 Tax=Nonlabens ponticola TaxID=2496866 RepID=A0A3S9N193_9FLAO|nr:glycosyltransferase [Nonlabens ponticola]
MSPYTTATGVELLYTGSPDVKMLDQLADGPGDIWHSGLQQGLANAFPELKYQAATFWWYINDFPNNDQVISWRFPLDSFVIRKNVWNQTQGIDSDYDDELISGLDFGYRLLRYAGATILHIDGLFDADSKSSQISDKDLVRFYLKFFKKDHLYYMISRQSIGRAAQITSLMLSLKSKVKRYQEELIEPRELQEIAGQPTVSYIIPTMMRQEMTAALLDDLAAQTYPPTQVIIIDATPESDRVDDIYDKRLPFELIVEWQTTKGSCRARNEALEHVTSDYVIFGDDDIKIQPQFVENHLRFLQTYKADACNGSDIMADHAQQDLSDLAKKVGQLDKSFFRTGVSQSFNNANSCVRREWIEKIGPNDVNYDGGYGEDSDYGIRLVKNGAVVLYNPFSINLHLKPPKGGYRFWGAESKKLGKARKKQPWEGDRPVQDIIPVPSPTINYFNIKHFTPEQNQEYKRIHLFKKWTKNGLGGMWYALKNSSYQKKQFAESMIYARALLKKGETYR